MKILTVFFSRRGENYAVGNIKEGNAEHIAKAIQEITNSDIFEIESSKGYSSDYKTCTQEALVELQKEERPVLVNDISIEQYEIIFLCYPNWWGTYPRPVATFLDNHDFTGKTVLPMCTHEGSGLGNSEAELRKTLKTSIIKKGLAIKGTNARTSDETIKKWVEENI